MSDDDPKPLARVTKLEIAAYVAPRVRSSVGRRIKITDVHGTVVRETTHAELVAGMCLRADIEFDVQVDARRLVATCVTCGDSFSLPKRGGDLGGGRMPVRCDRCRSYRQTECPGYGGPCPTGATPGRHAFQPYRIKARGGEPWRCLTCANRKGKAETPADQLSAAGKKAHAAQTTEQKREACRKAVVTRRANKMKNAAAIQKDSGGEE